MPQSGKVNPAKRKPGPAAGRLDAKVRRFFESFAEFELTEEQVRGHLGIEAGALPKTWQMKAGTRTLKELRLGSKLDSLPKPRPPTQRVAAEEHPRDSRFHDILLVRKNTDEDDTEDDGKPEKTYRFDRFRAVKEGRGRGGFKGPDGALLPEVAITDDGYRAVVNLATEGAGTADERGPVFSALPLNPDPAASSSCTCYLLNPGNLNYVTAWTAEEWSDRPGDEGPPLDVGEDTFNVLIATPGGKVYYLEKKTPGPLQEIDTADLVLREVNLGTEPEIWGQLRNGCVIGRTAYSRASVTKSGNRVTPLVNIHSLLPSPKAADIAAPAPSDRP